jgi:hypothetical protein
MIQIKLFLKDNDIPTLTAFSGNIDVDQLKPHIYIAQTTEIKRILGQELYNKIYNDYVNDSLTGIYQDIFEIYVIDMLTYFSCSLYMSFGGYKTTNNGVYKTSVEGSSNVDLKELSILVNKYNQLGVNVSQEFINFMKLNPVPEYKQENISKNIIPWY